uniref:Uncharacterized protein n=1 Tax=Cacopsylla melanoneura TaxID=428564 RepID=A0A8D9FBQ6_9HEMI
MKLIFAVVVLGVETPPSTVSSISDDGNVSSLFSFLRLLNMSSSSDVLLSLLLGSVNMSGSQEESGFVSPSSSSLLTVVPVTSSSASVLLKTLSLTSWAMLLNVLLSKPSIATVILMSSLGIKTRLLSLSMMLFS